MFLFKHVPSGKYLVLDSNENLMLRPLEDISLYKTFCYAFDREFAEAFLQAVRENLSIWSQNVSTYDRNAIRIETWEPSPRLRIPSNRIRII